MGHNRLIAAAGYQLFPVSKTFGTPPQLFDQPLAPVGYTCGGPPVARQIDTFLGIVFEVEELFPPVGGKPNVFLNAVG